PMTQGGAVEYSLSQQISAICDDFHRLPYRIFRNPLAQALGRELLHFCKHRQSLDPERKPNLDQACNALDASLKRGPLGDEDQRHALEQLCELGRRALMLYP